MSKPRVITNCVANRYAGPNDRTIEFASDAGGGLINLHICDHGRLLVSVYRCDGTVDVAVGQADSGEPIPVYQDGRRLDATVVVPG